MKIEGDKVFHHPVMVYPRSFSHDNVLEVVELKSGNDVSKGKHEYLSATDAIATDESWCESGSTSSDNGEDCVVKNQIDNEKYVPLCENTVENGNKNVSDSDVAKVIDCCKVNACFEVKDICIDEGLPTNLHMSEVKEKDETTSSAEAYLMNIISTPSSEASEILNPSVLSGHVDSDKAVVGEDKLFEATSAESTDHTAHGSDMKDLGGEYLFSSSKSPKCEEVNSSTSTESQGSGIIFDPLDRNAFENNQDNAATIAALIYGTVETNLATETTENGSITLAVDAPAILSGTKDRNSFEPVNQDKSKADAVSVRQPESLVYRHDHGESSFSYAGPVSGSVTYSGPIAFSGSLSLRSDSSTTSTRSFAFPILQNEWNSSPVRMAKGDRRRQLSLLLAGRMGVCESKERADSSSDGSGERTSTRVQDRRPDVVDIAVGVGLTVAAVGVVLYAMSRSDSSSGRRKTMKAPGMSNLRIFRDDFEDDPADYFRRLRDY